MPLYKKYKTRPLRIFDAKHKPHIIYKGHKVNIEGHDVDEILKFIKKLHKKVPIKKQLPKPQQKEIKKKINNYLDGTIRTSMTGQFIPPSQNIEQKNEINDLKNEIKNIKQEEQQIQKKVDKQLKLINEKKLAIKQEEQQINGNIKMLSNADKINKLVYFDENDELYKINIKGNVLYSESIEGLENTIAQFYDQNIQKQRELEDINVQLEIEKQIILNQKEAIEKEKEDIFNQKNAIEYEKNIITNEKNKITNEKNFNDDRLKKTKAMNFKILKDLKKNDLTNETDNKDIIKNMFNAAQSIESNIQKNIDPNYKFDYISPDFTNLRNYLINEIKKYDIDENSIKNKTSMSLLKSIINKKKDQEIQEGQEGQEGQEEQEGQGLHMSNHKGLTNLQIDFIMSPFKYYIKTINYNELDELLKNIKNDQLKFCFIMLINNYHWVAMFCDLKNNDIEYYDPFGNNPTKMIPIKFKNFLENLNVNHYCKFKINKIKQQSTTSSNCGWFCMNFLLKRLNNISFIDATKYKPVSENEHDIDEIKNKYNYFGYI